jgi:hypothetical protein
MGPDPMMLPIRTTPTLFDKPAVARSLKGKEKEWTAVAEKKRPLQLLDMPVDILKEIIEKVRHDHKKLVKVYILTKHSCHTPTISPHSRSATPSSTRSPFHTFTPASTLFGLTTHLLPCSALVLMP